MAKKSTPDWPLAPAPESKDHVKIQEQYELFIGGKWQKPKSRKYFDTINPANEQKLARIAEANSGGVVRPLSTSARPLDQPVVRAVAPHHLASWLLPGRPNGKVGAVRQVMPKRRLCRLLG